MFNEEEKKKDDNVDDDGRDGHTILTRSKCCELSRGIVAVVVTVLLFEVMAFVGGVEGRRRRRALNNRRQHKVTLFVCASINIFSL